ncbi:pentapeptide repeat-containing protein [Halorhabdus amylolytica]|uniref:pentapeptide repeat-containing protein n=1 Tax=Halorhabdus amylolytica TaxID=2559573 RepID=UPI0010AA5FBB|nr:pentapeptide repeat-containing protein [Halorhabdus amylolytica]
MSDGKKLSDGDHGGPRSTDLTRELEILRLSPAERRDRGIDEQTVSEAFLVVARRGNAEQKDLRGITLPALDLDRQRLEGVDKHPIDLREATIEGPISAAFATIGLPIRLDGATVGGFDFRNARFTGRLSASNLTVTGEIDAFEARFDGNVCFDGVTFEAPVRFDDAVLDNDVDFDDGTFQARAAFRGTEFHGDSNQLDDNTSFTGATFRGRADFTQAEFGCVHFEDVRFASEAVFEETALTGDVEFTRAVFDSLANFDEARFGEDTDFASVEFQADASFRGTAFAGGQRALEADLTFAGAQFHGEANFQWARFRGAQLQTVEIDGRADFENARFDGDAVFEGAIFRDEADFDEAHFGGDVSFSNVRFEARCTFRGAEFTGDDNFLEDDATFANAYFGTDAYFHDAEFTSANFAETFFGGKIDFSGCTFSDRVDFEATQIDGDAFVDFSRASIKGGRIGQPADGWVRYDMTLASVGDLELTVEKQSDSQELLDYFRFCRTEFDEFSDFEFDFSDHRDYLDRNSWDLHTFDEPPEAEPDYELEMTPEAVETTYLKAKQAAAEAGDMKVAGEFRVKRQQYSRRKNLEVIRDASAGLSTRVKNAGRAFENYFLGATCGHGMRPIRIALAFVVAPVLYVFPYVFGGSLFQTGAADGKQIALANIGQVFSPEGLTILFENARLSYISYTTIGYGVMDPKGPAAVVLAVSEAYLSVILSALLIYALVKRSEL